MPKTIQMPATPGFINSDFRLNRAVGATTSPFSGKTKFQEFDRVFWSASVTLPPMRREQAKNWQTFLLNLKGGINTFQFVDPDAKTNTGTYNGTTLAGEQRINNTNVTLSFSSQTITAGASTFANAVAGDFVHVTGADNEDNNGTHKIASVTSNTVIVTDSTLVSESNTASCKVRQNTKGAEFLSLEASSNSATGTIKQGDYLGLLGSTSSASADPVQLVYVTEDATLTTNGTKDHYSVAIQPKLRSDHTTKLVHFSTPKGLFRLATNEVGWSADRISNYGINFECIEVI